MQFSLFLQAQQRPLAPAAPLISYAAVSFSNVVATCCQYEALKYVAFPVQTLGKCAKMIPVMIWGTLISHKTYSAKDYTAALLVTTGCTVFLLNRSGEGKASRESSLLGGVLLLIYLTFDGFTSTFQVRIAKSLPVVHFIQHRDIPKQCWQTVLADCRFEPDHYFSSCVCCCIGSRL